MGGFGNVLFLILLNRVLSKKIQHVYYVNKLTKNNFLTKFLGLAVFQNIWDELIDKNKYKHVNQFRFYFYVFIGFLSKTLNIKTRLATYYKKGEEIENFISSNIFGYFQDYNFLKRNQTEILKLGNFLNRKCVLNKKNPIVVHFRKGDSVWAIKFAYYYDLVKKMLAKEKSKILIITDNKDDASSFFKELNNIEIISSNNDLDDFRFLISANKLYCAPSTFSWWAAHSLSPNSEVVIPDFLTKSLGVYFKNKKSVI